MSTVLLWSLHHKLFYFIYEMLSEYAPCDIQDEIERTQQHLDELKARIGNTES